MIHLTILNLKKTLFTGKVESITIPGEAGELTILPSHVPIITALKKGAIRATVTEKERYGGEENKYFESSGGIFEFRNNVATILL